jgi:hypothetical protein
MYAQGQSRMRQVGQFTMIFALLAALLAACAGMATPDALEAVIDPGELPPPDRANQTQATTPIPDKAAPAAPSPQLAATPTVFTC